MRFTDGKTKEEFAAKWTQKGKYICYRGRLASYLKERGFRPVSVYADPRNPNYNVYEYRLEGNILDVLYHYFYEE